MSARRDFLLNAASTKIESIQSFLPFISETVYLEELLVLFSDIERKVEGIANVPSAEYTE